MVLSRLLLLAALVGGLAGCATWHCDATTCPNGCCDSDGVCILNGGSSACGLNGSTCQSCQTCTNGVCGCRPGLELVGGKCLCTSRSCADGCCKDAQSEYLAQCITYASQGSSNCGTRGAECDYCSTLNGTCTAGVCVTCGSYLDSCTGSGQCCSGYSCTYDSFYGAYRCK